MGGRGEQERKCVFLQGNAVESSLAFTVSRLNFLVPREKSVHPIPTQ